MPKLKFVLAGESPEPQPLPTVIRLNRHTPAHSTDEVVDVEINGSRVLRLSVEGQAWIYQHRLVDAKFEIM